MPKTVEGWRELSADIQRMAADQYAVGRMGEKLDLERAEALRWDADTGTLYASTKTGTRAFRARVDQRTGQTYLFATK